MSSSGHRSPRLPLPEEKIHHEASAGEQKEDDVVPGIKDAPPSAEKIHHEASTSEQKQDDVLVEIEDDAPAYEEIKWADSILLANKNLKREQQPIGAIHRVPERLRQADHDAFEPKIISIGPYHYGKPRLQPMETHKRHSVEAILQRNPRCTLADYIHQIQKEEITARSRYSEKSDLESKEFVEMLLFDGCFVVEYLLEGCLPNLRDDGVLDTGTWMNDVIRSDLLLLENQLPFFIVYDIYVMVTGEHKFTEEHELVNRARRFFDLVSPVNTSDLTCEKPPANYRLVHHLLHLHHWFLFSTKVKNPQQESLVVSEQERPVLIEEPRWWRAYLFSFLRPRPPMRRPKPTNQGSSSKKLKCTIPSATFLEEAGIEFREKTEVTASLMDATFENGVMKITPLSIDAFTVSQFRNLIALEKFDPYIEPQVLAFSQFMDCIINTSEDVSLLRRKGIIEHALGSNEEVATFFNQLTSGTLEYHPPELTRMYEDVDEYCKRHRWRKIFIGNPLAVFALKAGAFLFALTFLQTFFSIFSYFRPPAAN